MFFVVSGGPALRNGETEEQLAPGDFVFCPEGREGLHTFTNQTREPARILAIGAGRFPDVVAYPDSFRGAPARAPLGRVGHRVSMVMSPAFVCASMECAARS
jgi:uncharacterized cupin superfamily protein